MARRNFNFSNETENQIEKLQKEWGETSITAVITRALERAASATDTGDMSTLPDRVRQAAAANSERFLHLISVDPDEGTFQMQRIPNVSAAKNGGSDE